MDLSKLPRLRQYLEGLPNGWDSHPRCQVKASTYRAGIDGLAQRIEPAELPDPLADLIVHPRPVSTWVPEVHNIAMYMAISDLRYPAREDFLDYMYRVFANFYASPLYRVLFFVASPKLMLKGSARTWGAVRRGTRLVLESGSDGKRNMGRIIYPQGLFNRISCECFARGIEAAYHAAGARSATVRITEWTPTFALTRSDLVTE